MSYHHILSPTCFMQVAEKTLLLPYSSNNCDFCDLMACFGYEHGSNYYRWAKFWTTATLMRAA